MAIPYKDPRPMSFRGRKILCVLAHPDDETIGCGATISEAVAEGAEVKVLLTLRRMDVPGRDAWSTVLEQFRESVHLLGAHAVVTDLPLLESKVWNTPHELVPLIATWIEWSDLVITHWPGDMHQSHRAVSQAVELSTRPFRLRRSVIQCEIPSASDQSFAQGFSPNLFVSVTEEAAAKKVEAMRFYAKELSPGRTPANLDRWLRVRGEQIGGGCAEAFVIARWFL